MVIRSPFVTRQHGYSWTHCSASHRQDDKSSSWAEVAGFRQIQLLPSAPEKSPSITSEDVTHGLCRNCARRPGAQQRQGRIHGGSGEAFPALPRVPTRVRGCRPLPARLLPKLRTRMLWVLRAPCAVQGGGSGAPRGESGGYRDTRDIQGYPGSSGVPGPGRSCPSPSPCSGGSGAGSKPCPAGRALRSRSRGCRGWMLGERRPRGRGRAGLGRQPPPGLPAPRSPRQGKAGALFSGRDAGSGGWWMGSGARGPCAASVWAGTSPCQLRALGEHGTAGKSRAGVARGGGDSQWDAVMGWESPLGPAPGSGGWEHPQPRSVGHPQHLPLCQAGQTRRSGHLPLRSSGERSRAALGCGQGIGQKPFPAERGSLSSAFVTLVSLPGPAFSLLPRIALSQYCSPCVSSRLLLPPVLRAASLQTWDLDTHLPSPLWQA